MRRILLASVLLFAICFAAGCNCPCSKKNACSVPPKVAAADLTSETIAQ